MTAALELIPDLWGPADARRWVIEHEASVWLNSNRRLHHMQEYRIGMAWKTSVAWKARSARIPTLGRAHIAVWAYLPPRAARTEVHNLHPTVKACVDGLRPPTGHVLPDDSDQHIVDTQLRRGPDRGKGICLLLRIVITEAT